MPAKLVARILSRFAAIAAELMRRAAAGHRHRRSREGRGGGGHRRRPLRLLGAAFSTKLVPRGCQGDTAVHAGGRRRGGRHGEGDNRAALGLAVLDKVVEILLRDHVQPSLRVPVGVVHAACCDHDERDACEEEGQAFGPT